MPAHNQAPSPNRGDSCPATCNRPPGLAHPPAPVKVTSCAPSTAAVVAPAPDPADERANLQRQITGALGNRVNRRESPPAGRHG
jgi:hypothetical protein